MEEKDVEVFEEEEGEFETLETKQVKELESLPFALLLYYKWADKYGDV